MAEQNNPLIDAIQQTLVGITQVTPQSQQASTSARESTVRSAPPVPVESLVKQVQSSNEAARAASKEAVATTQVQQDVALKAVKEGTEAANRVAMNKAKADLEVQNERVQFMQQSGGDEQLYKLARFQKEAEDKFVEQQRKVLELEDVTISDDGFFSWLGAQFRLSAFEYREANNATARVNAVNHTIANFQQATDAAAKSFANAEQSMNESTLEDAATAQRADLEKQVAELRIKNAQTNAKATAEEFTRDATAVQTINALRVSEWQARSAGTQARMLEMKEESYKRIAERANTARENAGLDPIYDVAEVTANFDLGERSEAYQRMLRDYNNGAVLMMAAEDSSIGNSFSEGTRQAIQVGGEMLVRSPKLNKHIQDTNLRVQQELEASGADLSKMSQQEIDLAINKQHEKTIEAETKELTPYGNSVFSAPTFSVLANSKAVQDTKLYKEVLSPISEILDKRGYIDEQQIFDLAATSVVDGISTPEEAAHDIATIFRAAANINTTTEQYTRFHIPPQSSYNIRLYDSINSRLLEGGAITESPVAYADPRILRAGTSQVYNAMDEVQVLNFLMRRIPRKTDLFKSLLGE